MIHKNRNNRRVMNIKKAKRKKRIVKSHDYLDYIKCDYGHLNKGKIHCSCPLCSAKSKHYLGRKIYRSEMSWKHADRVKRLSMNEKIKDYMEEK